MPPDRLLVLRAGVPPIRGRKITYYRERLFTRRVQPPPVITARPLPLPSGAGQGQSETFIAPARTLPQIP